MGHPAKINVLRYFKPKPHYIALCALVIVTALLLPVLVSAQPLNKSNALNIDKNAATNDWTVSCDIAVSGVDNQQAYSGRMLFEFLPEGQGSSTILFDALFQVDPANRVWSEASLGIYKVTAKLRGHDVVVHAEVIFNAINSGDRIFCSSRIDSGTQPPSVGATLFGANMVSTVQQP